MKREYSTIPKSMSEMETYGFSWMEFVTAIPSPLFVVTTYKSNGKPNACRLTSEKASIVNAPMIKECFLNLECRYLWEREIEEGSSHVLMCLEIVNICAEEKYLDEVVHGRYGEEGYLYNIHYPVNPENFNGRSHDWIGTLKKSKDMGEY